MLLDSGVWISKQDPTLDLPHQEMIVKDVELYKLPGSNDPATFRDIITLNPEIQYILQTFGENKTQSKVVDCHDSEALRPDAVVIINGSRSF